MSTSTIQPCFPKSCQSCCTGFYLFFPFLSSLFPLLAFLPPSLIPPLPPISLFSSFPSLSFSFLSPPLWKKEKMTPTLRPSLWSHRPASYILKSPACKKRLKVPGSGRDHWVGRIGLLFIVFPWPIGSSANFWSAPGSLPWSGPSTNLALSSPCISISPFSGCLCISSN